MSGPILSHPVALGDIHGGLDAEISAGPAERAALAVEYELLEVSGLSAAVTVTAEEGGGFEVAGRLVADIAQPCVVSLVPVPQHIDERFSVRFVRPGSSELPSEVKPHEEIVVDPSLPDPPDVLAGTSLDLGAIVEEAFVLAIDPYPRAPGAVLAEDAADQTDQPDSPFAVLAGLRSRKN